MSENAERRMQSGTGNVPNTSGGVILEVRDVAKEYPQGERPLRVLKGVSLQVAEGEYLAIVGASGAGKSRAIRLTSFRAENG